MANEITEALKRFFFPKEEVIAHWYSPLDNFQFITGCFYEMLEKQLVARKVPDLEISRVEFGEGGMLSDKREYLRLQRERLVFDICAAPFGTSYFFSFRFVELPLGIKPLELLVVFIGIGITFGILAKVLGGILGFLALLVMLVGGIYVMRNSLALGLKNLDGTLMKTPVIGPLYEIFLRKETYYRQDTRLMYLTTVNDITEMLVQEVTAAQGIKLLKKCERRPPGGNLYQTTTKPLEGGDLPPKPAL